MATKTSAKLAEMMGDKRLVRFERRFEPTSINGYILDIGPSFFLLLLVSDRIWFDGFECFRISDVRKLRAAPFADFVKTALRLRGQKVARKPRVKLSSAAELLRSAGNLFPLVTIHREELRDDVCWIGHVQKVTENEVVILEIGPDAVWEKKPTAFKLREITRIGFGADYEGALELVGGSIGS